MDGRNEIMSLKAKSGFLAVAIGLTSILLLTGCQDKKQRKEKPNIILILSDVTTYAYKI